MRILFLHDNFPAQFGVFGQYLAKQGWDVWFGTQRKGVSLPGTKTFNYESHRAVTQEVHPYAVNFERAILAGQAVARVALELKKKGLRPDIVMAHSGWGPGLFTKDIWPDAKYVGYFEWYYRPDAPDLVFASEGDQSIDDQLRARGRNASILMDLASCDAGICPTEFQKEQFPMCFHDKLTVMHDGIDSDAYRPDPGARLNLPNLDLSHVDEIITYVARGMEPYRGFPEFMKAMETVLEQRPNAHAVILGEDRVAYGKQLPKGESYKKRALKECNLDWSRVHFTGLLPRSQYLQVLQASTVHVYLTIPFVLSWSMMEAMSCGCAIVASDARPVREIFDKDPQSLNLVDYKAPDEIAKSVLDLLDHQAARDVFRMRARRLIVDNYSAKALFRRKASWLSAL
jgi:glycosyltransferase involved in cell wall biosynthesis